MSLPDVSVVIPAYAQANFLPRTLDSVAEQTADCVMETIVVDDGSPDDSAEVARRHPLRPTVISQENAGVAAARNTGINAARGRYVAFLDSDDVWHPAKLSRQLDELEPMCRPGLSFTRYQRKREDGRRAAEEKHPSPTLRATPRKLTRQNFIGCSTVVMSRSIFERVGVFPTDPLLQSGGQDYALWLRVAAYYPLVYVDEVLVDYTVHATNRVGSDPIKHFEGGIWALRSLWEWDRDRFRAMAQMDFSALVASRSARLLRDLLLRGHHRNAANLRRAVQAVLTAPRQRLHEARAAQ